MLLGGYYVLCGFSRRIYDNVDHDSGSTLKENKIGVKALN